MTSILIPIYNAGEALSCLLQGLSETLPANTPVILADDASTDSCIADVCHAFVEAHGASAMYVRQPQNLGFVGNVNQAMQAHVQDDVILLNSDTAVAAGWFEAMQACADSDPNIATITPWANNAEICSFPDFCQSNPWPEKNALENLMQAAARIQPTYPELPTGVGFCMFIRRKAWDTLGGFDQETFGKGYGEENDFCMRVAGHGWRNVLCDNAYVAHRGHASFAETGHTPGGQNLAALVARYPDYQSRVAQFILDDPLAARRKAFQAALDAQLSQ